MKFLFLYSISTAISIGFGRFDLKYIARPKSLWVECENHIHKREIIVGRVSEISEVRALQRYVSELLGYFAVKHGDARHLPNEAIGVVT